MDPSWERTHPGLAERWSFDFFTADGALGGFASLVLHPQLRRAWYWAALVGDERPYLLVRELEVALPRSAGSRQVRAEALWADINCETPFDHWSMGLEAFGVAMDDPREALAQERGDRVGLGLALEWEAVAGVAGAEGAYGQPGKVHGEVLVGGGSAVETIVLDGHGWRRHVWGALPCLQPHWSWMGGRLDDGVPYGAQPVALDDLRPLHHAPLRLQWHQGQVALDRHLVRFTTSDGRTGVGWAESVHSLPVTGTTSG